MVEPTPGPLPLVLLHGIGQGPMAWQAVVDVVGTSRQVLAPWLPGTRPGRIERFDVDAAAGEIATRISLSGFPRVALVGHSLGAVVAARLAATEPDLIDRMVLASPIVSPPGWVTAVQRGVVAVTPRGVFSRQGVTKGAVRSALAAVSGLDLRPDLGRVTCPVLLVVGSRDRAGRLAADEVVRHLPDASRRVLDGAGADLLRDAGPAFGQLVSDWLDDA